MMRIYFNNFDITEMSEKTCQTLTLRHIMSCQIIKRKRFASFFRHFGYVKIIEVNSRHYGKDFEKIRKF